MTDLASDPISALTYNRAWVEVDVGAISHNIRALQALLRPGTAMMAVIKADAYGHGALQVAHLAQDLGVQCLGVATVLEGVTLRQAGITHPIVILGAAQSRAEVQAIAQWRLEPTLCSIEQARLFSDVLAAPMTAPMTASLSVHLKIDTGMSRLGPLWTEGAAFIEQLQQFPHLVIASLYSHLATADDPDPSFMKEQQVRFDRVIQQSNLRRRPVLHLSNSAGTLFSPAFHYDLVRVGLALYGIYPGPQFLDSVELRPAMQVRTRIVHLKTLPAGVGVSYGHRFTTSAESKIATLGIGYADGVPRNLSNRMQVLIRGQRVPQVGTITMDQIMVDVSRVSQVQVGDVVTLIGRDEDEAIWVKEWSDLLGTIPYEIVCGFKQRLPRTMRSEGSVFLIANSLDSEQESPSE
jgi:alanine racemase